jgi:hypothetical protein
MTQEALKLALEALESSDKLINGSGNHFGLEGAMDGYYSGCFDVGGNNKLLNKAITAIKEALAHCPDCGQLLGDAGHIHTCSPQRTWVGLTDDECDHLAGLHLYAMKRQVEASIEGVDDFAKAIEAKLKEKNT